MTFEYEYKNQFTRGWVRGEMADLKQAPANLAEATTVLESIARMWSNGTDLRLVEIAADGAETFPPVTAKGNRGPLPKDRKDV